MKNTKKHIPTTFVKMFKKHVRAKVEFFDDVGEIQIVPIDTIVDDGAPDLQADDLCRNQSQGFGARGFETKDANRYTRPRWKEPDIVA